MPEPIIRILESHDAAAFQTLRLRGLQDVPTAFTSSFEEEAGLALEDVARRIGDHRFGVVFGAYIDGQLVGLMGVRRERARKLAHRGFLWGVYVAPEGRQHGVGFALGTAALNHAKENLRVRQVILGVGANNEPALALYRRLGFEQFALERDYLYFDGVYWDEVHMIHFFRASANPA